MRSFAAITALLALAGSALATPINRRQGNACFIVGNTALPKSVADSVTAVQGAVTCSSSGATTLSGVPDVTSGAVSFSSVDFSKAPRGQSTLAFALQEFATAEPLASTDLQRFEDSLNVYLATEAGIRSVGGNLAIKVPKFFLEFQVSRIKTAQGNAPTEPGLQVTHLRDKVTKNAAGQSKALLDQVVALAAQLK
ncbi:hypothetical protein MN608_01267 [Microdochium nivale]|nr:hypothetical protein MN608_01267 [Microdochium nivale]